MVKKYTKVAIFFIVLSVIGSFAYYVYKAKQVIYIRAVRVEVGTVTATVIATSSGIVESRNDIMISSQTSGVIDKLFVREGDIITKREIIALLDQKEAIAQVELSEANLAAVKASYEQALADYGMVKTLVNTDISEAKANLENAERGLQRANDLKNIIPEEDIDNIKRNHEVAVARYEATLANLIKIKVKEQEVVSVKAAIEQKEALLSVAIVNLDYTKIIAPFTGVISEIVREAGEFVSTGTPIVKLIDNANLYIKAAIDEFDLSRMDIGQPVKIHIDAFSDKHFKGILTRILPVVSAVKMESRTSKVEIELNPGTDNLVPGLSADVEIVVGVANDVPYVPTSAIMERDSRRFVFVEKDGKVHEREIKIGLSNWGFTEIKSGLIEGENVITTLDDVNLKEGSRVKIKE